MQGINFLDIISKVGLFTTYLNVNGVPLDCKYMKSTSVGLWRLKTWKTPFSILHNF